MDKGKTVWLTGLSGAGKSTLAELLHHDLQNQGILAFVLDGDAIRSTLNSDLGFSIQDRRENIRRIAHIARIMNLAGLIVIAAVISPTGIDRQMAREIIGEDDFFEVYIKATLDQCILRDVKGLYSKALAGKISNFTGVSMPYEEPRSPGLTIDTDLAPIDACVSALSVAVMKYISVESQLVPLGSGIRVPMCDQSNNLGHHG